MMRTMITFLFGLCLLIFVAGCQSEESIDFFASEQTLIIYMGGDNNLSIETSAKFAAIESFARNNLQIEKGEVNILIYQDTNKGAKLYKIHSGMENAELLGMYYRENSASSEVFGRVLRDCLHLAPAANYGLIVFSHASGWLPEGALLHPSGPSVPAVSSRSLIIDGRSEMDIKDFAQVIPDGTFDYIVFEACFMAGVEVAYELKDKTKYIVGSSAEMLSPGFTAFYPAVLADLCNTSVPLKFRLIGLAKTYFGYYDSQQGQSRSATVSVLQTDGLVGLSEAMKRDYAGSNAGIERVQHFDRYGYRLFFDLGDYVEQTNTKASDAILTCIDEVVVFAQSTPTFLPVYNGFTIKKHCGLTTYIEQDGFPYLNQKHRELKWRHSLD